MTTYVLVHGAWSGAHGFKKLRPLLQQAGHDVYTPSLTGIGERSHLTSPMINLTTHIHDVVNTVLYEDLTDIVLLGFSYGGMVITGALEHIRQRVSHLVYLDAFVPANGQSALDLRGAATDSSIEINNKWVLTPVSRAMDEPADAEWFGVRRSDQPLATFSEAVRLPIPLAEQQLGLTYIKATADETETADSAFWKAGQRAHASDHWTYHEINTNHMIAINRPQELAELLLGIAN